MPTCCAMGCTNTPKSGLKLYRLPVGERNKDRRNTWLERIARDKWTPTIHSRLCEIHFEDDQFESHRADNKRLLKQNAVPSIFSPKPAPKSKKPFAACKTRWRTIRDSYKKTKNKMEMKSKNGLTPFTKSKYTNENLKFLDESFNDRPTYASQLSKYNWTPDDSNSEEYLKVNEAPDIMLQPQIKLEIIESDENTDGIPSKAEDNSTTGDNDSETGNSNLPVNESYILGPSCEVPTATETTKKRKRTFVGPLEEEAKRRREEQMEESSVSQADVTPVAENVSDDSEHPIQTFFRSMASTAMSFPPHLIVEARMRVNEIISELELRSMSEQNIQEYSLSFEPLMAVSSASVPSIMTRVTCVSKTEPSTKTIPISNST